MANYNPKLETFIKEVFNELNCIDLPYVILRNYELLPKEVGNDIDLLVLEKDLDNFSEILFNKGSQDKWYLSEYHNRYGFSSFIFTLGDSNILKWDIWAPISWKGFKWVDSSVLMENRLLVSKQFYIPSPGSEAAVLVLKFKNFL